MEDIKISVVVPVYNTEKYISECLDSLINQTLKEIEIICINDGSTDKSLEILNEVNSSNILELGLGQTTKMTTQYASYFDNVQLQVIEDNQSWTDTFSENLELTDNVSIDYCDVEEFDCNGTTSLRYSDLDKIIKDKKFDLIIIDGPKGFLETEEGPVELEYSRTNIWALIEKNLSKDFIIILDDFNRIGEQNTAEYICELISNKNIDYYTQVYRGSKNQIIITSEKNRFVTWF